MLVYRLHAVLALSAMALTGCANFGGPINGSDQAVLSPEERRLQDLENKTAVISRRLDTLDSSAADQDIIKLKDEIRDLRGIVEKLRYDSDQRDRQQKDRFQDVDTRLQRLEGTAPGAVGGTVPGATPGTISSVPVMPRPAVASPEEEAAYLATFDLLKNGKYDDAVRGFKSMLERWPQGRYADNAWYWMGEANYVKRDYNSALSSFQALVDRFPTSPKLADGLYKVGLTQIELKRVSEAKATLQRVAREFPATNAATLSRQKLDQLGG